MQIVFKVKRYGKDMADIALMVVCYKLVLMCCANDVYKFCFGKSRYIYYLCQWG